MLSYIMKSETKKLRQHTELNKRLEVDSDGISAMVVVVN
jgi:hypothetical protein